MRANVNAVLTWWGTWYSGTWASWYWWSYKSLNKFKIIILTISSCFFLQPGGGQGTDDPGNGGAKKF